MVTQISKLRKAGNSLITTINRDIVESLNLKENDDIYCIVVKIKKPDMVSYRCKKCEHRFDVDDKLVPYCPACDCEDLEALDSQELKGGDNH
jgi:antitoxin component of MazEF toxin-antitoxin module